MPTRFHSLDAVRAAALLLGIVLHTAMSFSPNNVPAALARRSADALPFVLGQHYIHIFRMAIFFLIAGFFGRLLLRRRGIAGFIRNRLTRILLPLVLGWSLFYPMLTCATIWRSRASAAPLSDGHAAVSLWRETLSFFTSGEFSRFGLPLEYFWFLYYLLLIYAMVLCLDLMSGIWADAAGRVEDFVFSAVFESWYGALCVATPVTGLLYRMRDLLGVRTPHNLVPDKAVLLTYLTFFLLGWLLARRPDLLPILGRRALRSMAVGVVAGAWPLVLLARTADPAHAHLTAIERFSGNTAYGLAMAFMTFGFVGMFVRWMSTPRRVVRYLSDSAYWIYLAHLPVIVGLQAALAPWHAHWSVKILAIILSSTAVLLLSYHFLVRHTWIGVLLSGPRRTPITDAAGQLGPQLHLARL